MKSLQSVFGEIDASREEIIRTAVELVGYPALAPINGGTGEGAKADYIVSKLKGFDSVERIEFPDRTDPSVMRPNIIARKKGKGKGTLWIVSHMDVVPTGDPELWDTPPFEGVYKDGRIYGRGTEDNGQSVVSSMFAARPFLDEEFEGMSLALAYVADEETSSVLGIQSLLEKGLFSEDDAIMVPDWGSPGGTMIGLAEKSVLWLRFVIEGRTTHGSTPELGVNAGKIVEELAKEEERFSKTLENGLKEIEKVLKYVQGNTLNGKTAFRLYDTYGFPIEMTVEICKEKGYGVDMDGYKKAFEEHQQKSHAGAEQKFKGGLADSSEMTTYLHTATHILLATLKKVLGRDDIQQKGSNITPERLRFDFNFERPLTEEEKKAVEDGVNDAIRRDLPVTCEEMTVEEARRQNAVGVFGSRYGEIVKVYTIGDVDKEICGGPHAEHTGLLGKFRIVKEQSSSAGVRRIKAVLEAKTE